MRAAVALAFVVLAAAGCGGSGSAELSVERAKLSPGRIQLTLVNGSDEDAQVEQVILNDAFVDFRAGANWITVLYPWVEGESYELELLTSTGATVEYEIEEAESA